eukprot:scaffold10924_cov51-Phaeocystis_antarctica.AAC.1
MRGALSTWLGFVSGLGLGLGSGLGRALSLSSEGRRCIPAASAAALSLCYDSTYSGPTYYGGGLLDDTPVLQPEDDASGEPEYVAGLDVVLPEEGITRTFRKLCCCASWIRTSTGARRSTWGWVRVRVRARVRVRVRARSRARVRVRVRIRVRVRARVRVRVRARVRARARVRVVRVRVRRPPQHRGVLLDA